MATPFVLISTRSDDALAAQERDSFLRWTGLPDRDLRQIRAETEQGARQVRELDLEPVTGVMLGGSPYCTSIPEQDKAPDQVRAEAALRALLDRVLAQQVPLFGACYGVGTLGAHQGGTLDGTYAEPVGQAEITLTAQGRQDPLLEGMPAVFHSYVGHQEALTDVPPGAVLLAGGRDCPVQMFRVGPAAWATQFHPELDQAALFARMEAYRDHGYFDPLELAQLKERIAAGPSVAASHALLERFVAVARRVRAGQSRG